MSEKYLCNGCTVRKVCPHARADQRCVFERAVDDGPTAAIPFKYIVEIRPAHGIGKLEYLAALRRQVNHLHVEGSLVTSFREKPATPLTEVSDDEIADGLYAYSQELMRRNREAKAKREQEGGV